MKTVYVVSVRQIKNLSEEWGEHILYAYKGEQFNAVYWTENIDEACTFDTADSAEKWFYKNHENMRYCLAIHRDRYDMKSLCVKRVIYKASSCEFEKNLVFKEM